jgi:metallo-beta-lactamase class B
MAGGHERGRAARAAVLLLVALSTPATGSSAAQGGVSDADRHVAAGRAAAGDEHVRAFAYLCEAGPATRGSAAPSAPRGMPEWYAYPRQVFDNLYFVGTTSLNAWAVTTSEGIVVIDPLYDYQVDLAVIRGLEMLGLDPEDVTHVIVNHGHGDHYGGARRLQQTFGAAVVMGAADWEMMEETPSDQPKPERGVAVTDARTLTVGDTPFTLELTPGHTPGGTSLVFPVRAGGRTHVVSMWGGTATGGFGDDRDRFRRYIASVDAFADASRRAGADVLLSNHDIFDESQRKMAALPARADDAHPFVVGTERTQQFLEVVRHCAMAALARLDAVAR